MRPASSKGVSTLINSREAIMPEVPSMAVAVAVRPLAIAQTPAAENSELEPIRSFCSTRTMRTLRTTTSMGTACLSEKATITSGGPREISEDVYQALTIPL